MGNKAELHYSIIKAIHFSSVLVDEETGDVVHRLDPTPSPLVKHWRVVDEFTTMEDALVALEE